MNLNQYISELYVCLSIIVSNTVYTKQCIHKIESIIGHKRCILSAQYIILHIWSVHSIYIKVCICSVVCFLLCSAGEAGPQFDPDFSSSWSRRSLCGETSLSYVYYSLCKLR